LLIGEWPLPQFIVEVVAAILQEIREEMGSGGDLRMIASVSPVAAHGCLENEMPTWLSAILQKKAKVGFLPRDR
jgi:hypothetical protein